MTHDERDLAPRSILKNKITTLQRDSSACQRGRKAYRQATTARWRSRLPNAVTHLRHERPNDAVKFGALVCKRPPAATVDAFGAAAQRCNEKVALRRRKCFEKILISNLKSFLQHWAQHHGKARSNW